MVITGASGGIGAALAQRLGAAGGRPVLAARRERELREAAARCGPEALSVVADVTRRDDVQKILDAALARFDRLDVWVNNAGRGITRPVSALSAEDFHYMMNVNALSALFGMQVALGHFRRAGRGHIINISSMLGRLPLVPARSAYSAAKHALNCLTASLRMELRERWPDIHVSTVSPGVVATEFGIHALGGGPDSRALPNSQPVAEVVDVILDLIARPRADVYTRPGMQQMVVEYFAADDLSDAEAKLSFPRSPQRT